MWWVGVRSIGAAMSPRVMLLSMRTKMGLRGANIDEKGDPNLLDLLDHLHCSPTPIKKNQKRNIKNCRGPGGQIGPLA